MLTDYERLKFIIGKDVDDNLKAKIKLVTTKAYNVYFLPIGSIITLDYRSDRLRIYTENNKVVRYSIG